MKTEVLQVEPDPPEGDPTMAAVGLRAAECLAAGGIVAFPTETVYGLAVQAPTPVTSRSPVLERLKGRPPERPLPIAVADRAAAEEIVSLDHPGLDRLAERFWPGPITLLAPTHGGETTLGLRVPALRAATQLLRAFGRPIQLTSANLSDGAPARTPGEVLEVFDGRVDLLVDAGPIPRGEPSTVVGFDGHRALIHRAGLIDASMVYRTAATKILIVCTGNTCRSPMAEAAFRSLWAARREIAAEALLEYGGWVSSAGVHAVPGICASLEAVEVLAARDIDLRQHRSAPLSEAVLLQADHVYTMSRTHRQAILDRLPEDLREEMGAKVQLLSPSNRDIDDPIGREQDVYAACYEQIHRAVEQRIEEVEAALEKRR